MKKYSFIAKYYESPNDTVIEGDKMVYSIYCKCGETEKVQVMNNTFHSDKFSVVLDEFGREEVITCFTCGCNEFKHLPENARFGFNDTATTFFDNGTNYALSTVGFKYFHVKGQLVLKRIRKRFVFNKQTKNLYYIDGRKLRNASKHGNMWLDMMSINSEYALNKELFITALLDLLPDDQKTFILQRAEDGYGSQIQEITMLIKRPYLWHFLQHGMHMHITDITVPTYHHQKLLRASSKAEVFQLLFGHRSEEFITLVDQVLSTTRNIPVFLYFLKSLDERHAISLLQMAISLTQNQFGSSGLYVSHSRFEVGTVDPSSLFRNKQSYYRFLYRNIKYSILDRNDSLSNFNHYVGEIYDFLKKCKYSLPVFDSQTKIEHLIRQLEAIELKQKEDIHLEYYNYLPTLASLRLRWNSRVHLKLPTSTHEIIDAYIALTAKKYRITSTPIEEHLRRVAESKEYSMVLLYQDDELIDLITIQYNAYGDYLNSFNLSYNRSLRHYHIPEAEIKMWARNEFMYRVAGEEVSPFLCQTTKQVEGTIYATMPESIETVNVMRYTPNRRRDSFEMPF